MDKQVVMTAADRQPTYYAVWLGTPDTWSYLYTTTGTERDAQQIVANVGQFGRSAYYTTEQGPIVPLGRDDE